LRKIPVRLCCVKTSCKPRWQNSTSKTVFACGLPALTTTTNGSSEIITESTNGYVIEGATGHLATDLAEKIKHFCDLTPEQRKKMRINSQKTAETYTIRRNAEEFIECVSS